MFTVALIVLAGIEVVRSTGAALWFKTWPVSNISRYGRSNRVFYSVIPSADESDLMFSESEYDL